MSKGMSDSPKFIKIKIPLGLTISEFGKLIREELDNMKFKPGGLVPRVDCAHCGLELVSDMATFEGESGDVYCSVCCNEALSLVQRIRNLEEEVNRLAYD